MAHDEPAEAADPAESTREAPVGSAPFGPSSSPGRSLAVAGALVLVVRYAVLVRQELLLVGWLLAIGSLVYLFRRFVRAHERIPAAAVRMANRRD